MKSKNENKGLRSFENQALTMPAIAKVFGGNDDTGGGENGGGGSTSNGKGDVGQGGGAIPPPIA